MSLCKSLNTMLDMESESESRSEDLTQPRGIIEDAIEPNKLLNTATVKKTNRARRSLDQPNSAIAEKKIARPRKTGRKNNVTISVDTPSTSVEDHIISSALDNTMQKKLIDFGITTQVHTILLAIKENRVIELFFVDTESNPPRTFEPRQLIFDAFAQSWYVWGWDRRYNTERHHLVALLDKINIVDGMGRSAQGPYKDDVPANFIGGWLGGEVIPVKLIVLKQWIFAVRQAPLPFPEFKIEELEEGKAQVTFVATDLRSIARWVMQFGDGVQIITPQRLIDRIKQVGLTWSGKSAAIPPRMLKTAQRQDQHQERRADNRHDIKPDTLQDYKNLEHPKQNKEATEGVKISKVEIIRTGRL